MIFIFNNEIIIISFLFFPHENLRARQKTHNFPLEEG